MASPVAAVVLAAAKQLVDAPDKVVVTETEHRGATLVELTVGANDTGKVIGRQGRTAEALRTLVAATAAHHGIRATLEIRDPE
jgi:predicted RNA-binding protein YlqC (UPF0109 family)